MINNLLSLLATCRDLTKCVTLIRVKELLIRTRSNVSGSAPIPQNLVSRGYFLSFLPAPAQAGTSQTGIEVVAGRSPICI